MRGNLMSLARARGYVSQLAVAEEQEVQRVETVSGVSADVDGWKVIYNKTDDRVATIPTEKYQLVQHKEFFSQVLDAVEELEFDVKHVNVKDARERVDFEIIPVNAPTFNGEQVAVGIRASNSIDTTIAARIQAYGLRLVCTNGLMGRTVFGGESLIHVAENISTEKIRDAIEEVLPIAEERLGEVVSAAIDTKVDNAKRVLEDAGFGGRYVDEIVEKFYQGTIDRETGEVKGDLSAWSIYCASTEVIERGHAPDITEKTREDLHRKANRLLPVARGESVGRESTPVNQLVTPTPTGVTESIR